MMKVFVIFNGNNDMYGPYFQAVCLSSEEANAYVESMLSAEPGKRREWERTDWSIEEHEPWVPTKEPL